MCFECESMRLREAILREKFEFQNLAFRFFCLYILCTINTIGFSIQFSILSCIEHITNRFYFLTCQIFALRTNRIELINYNLIRFGSAKTNSKSRPQIPYHITIGLERLLLLLFLIRKLLLLDAKIEHKLIRKPLNTKLQSIEKKSEGTKHSIVHPHQNVTLIKLCRLLKQEKKQKKKA